MFAPIAALLPQPVLITGSGSLLNRPMDFFEKTFPQLGVTVSMNEGKLPLEVRGPLHPTDISIDGSLSSQFLTGLLMAFAKAAVSPVTIRVSSLTSKPYIDLTLSMMEHFGYEVMHENYERFFIEPQTPNPKPIDYSVEGDWSSASFLLVAGAIAGPVTVKGLDVFSAQADKAILQILMQAGVPLSVSEEEIIVSPPALKKYQAFQFNARDCPDLFPPAVVLAAYCQGTSVIEGVGRLLHKESDRAASLQEEFGKLGIKIVIQDDLMLVTGASVKGARVNAHEDHRIAMACAVAALSAEGETTIGGAEAVNKSYPAFYDNLKMLGANVSLPTKE
ncbi:MAG: 3-phosphoshikimate 1-carboxyvinyltransferase [Chitinophagaceae bacterium]|nr:3-phosphoshikimate 1-carboxyvinyltransferase [Chitinophagaceae bacterium]